MTIKKTRVSKGLKRRRQHGGDLEQFSAWLSNIGDNLQKASNNLNKNINDVREDLITKMNSSLATFKMSKIYEGFDDNAKNNLDKWTVFITRFVKSECESEEGCNLLERLDNEPLTEEEATQKAADIAERFKTKKVNKKLIRISPEAKQERETEQQQIYNIINKFDDIFEKILILVSLYFGSNKLTTKGCSTQFRNMISLLRALPNIDNNLDILLGKDIQGLGDRYAKILELLNTQCVGMMQYGCSFAAQALGKEIFALYEKLYKNRENTSISETTLLEFIRDIVPIMIMKLDNIQEFIDDIHDLKQIGIDITKIPITATGGKKSSGAIRKEILGKLMKIYKIPNDKKEYVRHKGHLISIKQYKEEAKMAKIPTKKPVNNTKPPKPTKKLILGKERCIYKVQGSKKDHIKYKGTLIPVADYKKLLGAR